MKLILAWTILFLFACVFATYFICGMTDGFRAMRNLWSARALVDYGLVATALMLLAWALLVIL